MASTTSSSSPPRHALADRDRDRDHLPGIGASSAAGVGPRAPRARPSRSSASAVDDAVPEEVDGLAVADQ